MRKAMALMTLVWLVGGPVAPARAHGQMEEAGLSLAATTLELVYLPAKILVAAMGLVVGGVAGVLSGGDTRAAYAFWVPAASGTYLLTPAHIEGAQPIEFFGSDYADRPSPVSAGGEAGMVYEAGYGPR